MISRRSIMKAINSSFLVMATGALVQDTMLMGTVNYRERMARPQNATVLVQRVDVSLADASAQLIAEDRVTGVIGSPISYRLRFDITKIQPRRTYESQARISGGDRLLFVYTIRHEVFASGRNNTRIPVQRVHSQANQTFMPSSHAT